MTLDHFRPTEELYRTVHPFQELRVIGWRENWKQPIFVWIRCEGFGDHFWFYDDKGENSWEVINDTPTHYIMMKNIFSEDSSITEYTLGNMEFNKIATNYYELGGINISRPVDSHDTIYNRILITAKSYDPAHLKIDLSRLDNKLVTVYDGLVTDIGHLKRIFENSMISEKYRQ